MSFLKTWWKKRQYQRTLPRCNWRKSLFADKCGRSAIQAYVPNVWVDDFSGHFRCEKHSRDSHWIKIDSDMFIRSLTIEEFIAWEIINR